MNKSLILNKIKEYKKFSSDAEFARYLGIPAQNLSKWKSRNTYDVELLYTKCSEINPEWLLTGKGEMLKDEIQETQVKAESKVPQVVTVDSHQKDNVVLVPVKAQAGYLTGYDDPVFIQNLPTYSLPGIRNGVFRMFQVGGFSMYPTLQNNSYVVGQFVEDWRRDISDNRVYVVVTREHGVIVKRVLNRIDKYGSLYCKSDNRDYPNIAIKPEEIQEVWECKMQLSFEFLDPADIYHKLSDLESEIYHLKEKLNIK